MFVSVPMAVGLHMVPSICCGGVCVLYTNIEMYPAARNLARTGGRDAARVLLARPAMS